MNAVRATTVAAALGTGAMGGVFFAFSTFVMRGLARLPASQGMAAMQSINVAAVRPGFMTGLFGSAALCVGLGVHALRHRDRAPARLVLAAAAIYLLGTIVLTIAYHVPRNDALARLVPSDPATAAYWRNYVSAWTSANHVRTASSLAASLLLVLALVQQGDDRPSDEQRAVGVRRAGFEDR